MNREGTAYVKELASINRAIKGLNIEAKALRERRAELELALREYMENRNLEKYEGITLKKLLPKTRAKRVPKKVKQERAVELFARVGIPNPTEFYKQFVEQQSVLNSSRQ
uniref:Host-nuclease inhibitor protein n=1 Tax=viral metagenome TaxID=1070528 RepID=A0A6C0LZ36_9ZZZZ